MRSQACGMIRKEELYPKSNRERKTAPLKESVDRDNPHSLTHSLSHSLTHSRALFRSAGGGPSGSGWAALVRAREGGGEGRRGKGRKKPAQARDDERASELMVAQSRLPGSCTSCLSRPRLCLPPAPTEPNPPSQPPPTRRHCKCVHFTSSKIEEKT